MSLRDVAYTTVFLFGFVFFWGVCGFALCRAIVVPMSRDSMVVWIAIGFAANLLGILCMIVFIGIPVWRRDSEKNNG